MPSPMSFHEGAASLHKENIVLQLITCSVVSKFLTCAVIFHTVGLFRLPML